MTNNNSKNKFNEKNVYRFLAGLQPLKAPSLMSLFSLLKRDISRHLRKVLKTYRLKLTFSLIYYQKN